MVSNYVPGGAVLLDAMTLKPVKVYPTSSVVDMDGNIGSSRVASIADTPYGPYIAFALKDAGHVYIVRLYNQIFQLLEIFREQVKCFTTHS